MQIPALEPRRDAPSCPRCKVALARVDLTEAERSVLKALRASYRCACGYQIAPGASLAIPKLLALRERERVAQRNENQATKLRIARARTPQEEQIGFDAAIPHQVESGDDEVLVVEEARPQVVLPALTEETLDLGDWQPISGERPLGEI
jgi:Na+-transporting NADH:ubiquinone oxidoreductase subunit NqrF